MKKLLFLAAFLLPMMANAQYGSLVEIPLYGDESSLVRLWTGHDSVLSYGQAISGSVSKPTFFLSDYASFYSSTPPPVLSTKYADLHATWGTMPLFFTHVRDMRIVDDYVFVCGDAGDTNNPLTAKSAIGWFNLNDFGTPNITFQYFEIPIRVHYLKKIAAYRCGPGYTVLALGEDANAKDYIFEIKDVTTLSSYYYVNYREFTSSSFWDKEAADDILVTGNEVFVVGNLRTPPSERQLCIWKADRTNVVGDPQFYTRYDYTAASSEVNANTYSTLIDEEYIATAYVHASDQTGPSDRLRIINTNTMNMVNSQEIIRDNKWEPEEMVYVNNRKKLVLLQEHNSIWNFILLEPMNNTAYVADYLYHPNAVYYSLDSDHNDLFVSTGEKNRLYFQRLGMALPSPIGCPKNERIEVISIKDIPTSISPSLQSYGGNSAVVFTVWPPVIPTQIIPVCNSPLTK